MILTKLEYKIRDLDNYIAEENQDPAIKKARSIKKLLKDNFLELSRTTEAMPLLGRLRVIVTRPKASIIPLYRRRQLFDLTLALLVKESQLPLAGRSHFPPYDEQSRCQLAASKTPSEFAEVFTEQYINEHMKWIWTGIDAKTSFLHRLQDVVMHRFLGQPVHPDDIKESWLYYLSLLAIHINQYFGKKLQPLKDLDDYDRLQELIPRIKRQLLHDFPLDELPYLEPIRQLYSTFEILAHSKCLRDIAEEKLARIIEGLLESIMDSPSASDDEGALKLPSDYSSDNESCSLTYLEREWLVDRAQNLLYDELLKLDPMELIGLKLPMDEVISSCPDLVALFDYHFLMEQFLTN